MSLNASRKHHVPLSITQYGTGDLIKNDQVRLTSDTSTTSTTPSFTTLLSLSFFKTETDSVLHLTFTCAWTHTGVGGVSQGAIFRYTIDGGAVSGGSSDSTDTGLIHVNRLFSRVSGIAAGNHTIEIQWTRSTASSQTLRISPTTSNNLYHAEMIVREEAT